MENQRLILNASHSDKAIQAERIRKMKADLTTTNFKLGDARDKTEYMSTNHQSMLQAVQHPIDAKERLEKAELNRTMKEAVKRSSLEFGREPIRYESVMTEEMKRNPGGVVDFQKRKKEIATMKQALSKHNFTFGNAQEFNEKTWETDYASGYGSLPHEAYLHKHLHADEIKASIAVSISLFYSILFLSHPSLFPLTPFSRSFEPLIEINRNLAVHITR